MKKYQFNPPIYKTIGWAFTALGAMLAFVGVVQYLSSANSHEDKVGLLTMLGMAGIVSVTLGGIILICYYATENGMMKLINRNEFVMADIIAIEPDTERLGKGVPMCYVACEWKDPLTQKVHYFESKSFFLDPDYYIPVIKCKVFCDSSVDYDDFYVDTDWLLETKMKKSDK